MSWLRIDDGFTHHPKFAGWTIAQRWALLELMEYCARYETRGRVPDDFSLLPRAVTPAVVELAKRSGWLELDPVENLWTFHDWDEYNPPQEEDGALEERVQRALRNYPDASANELARIVGGRRKQALELIRRFRPGTGSVPNTGSPNGSGNRAGTGSSRPLGTASRSEAVTTREAGEPDEREPGPSERPRDSFIDPTGGAF